MACDRFIYFDKGKVPSKADVGMALEDYLGNYMVSCEWINGAWVARLVGNKSWPFRRLEADSRMAAGHAEEAKEGRCIEVFIDKDNIDVITRRTDEVTMNIADGFAKLIVRYWKGREG